MTGTVTAVIPLEEARARILAACPRLPAVSVAMHAASGCVTAEDVYATEDVPPFDNTAVDGFAVRAADVANAPVELVVVATVAAGAHRDAPLGPGEAVRIMTGAPLPPAADAIVMVEDSEAVGDDRVRLLRAVVAGDAVRRAGSDIRAGELVLRAGIELAPPHIGVLASLGRLSVNVHQRPRVGVLSTGDELIEDGSPLQPGQIRESNRTMLRPMIAEAGCDVIDLGLVRDDEQALTQVLRNAVETCDALVTSGGVSMGDFDVVKAVLSRIADMTWMQIAIRPAKPFAFGLLKSKDGRTVPIFGLPGNPVSSFVSFELLARPALRQMLGHRGELLRPSVLALADEPFRRRPDGKTHWTRVHGRFESDGRLHVRSTGEQGSHQLAASAGANGLAEVPDGDGIEVGGELNVILLNL